ncbi:tripartite tricarboxylate transporter substrate binding protein [Roseomonas sp. NAR14]|uniref:Tripartite tricarboxylate transporter substrate binding protein n=1 Tax=Roseomonas acroporae TaxID=2937791 RepID=A0A9X1Y8F7_9PROT|nr:tripartite tricarboxylate transporter substrate binding protein [Roseomonas acroporae]MCK8785005.1 tripartite tricarboxylate transporter substrate binding protein [Roseomonas acroporae]
MPVTRRHALQALAALSVTPLPFARPAFAQGEFPDRPLKLILPYAPGGGTDALARVLAGEMQKHLGQPVVVDNRPGAGGNIATEVVAREKPDGYTILMGNQGPMAVNPTLFGRNMPVDPERTLEPVGLVADAALVVVVGPGTPAKSLAELIAEGKKERGKLSYGSAGNGSASHLAAALFCQMAGIEAEHLPFRGAAPALNDVVAGHIPFMITTLPSVVGLLQGTQVRALAVTGEHRAAVLPDLPTVAETLPGYRASAWYGLLVPKGTPEAIRARLLAAMQASLRSPEMQQRLRDEGADPGTMDGPAFGRFIRAERERWAPVIRAANITVD